MEFTTSEWLPRSGVFVHFCAFLAFFLSYEGRGGRVRRSFFHFVSFTGHGCWWSFTPTTVDCTFYFWLDHFCLRRCRNNFITSRAMSASFWGTPLEGKLRTCSTLYRTRSWCRYIAQNRGGGGARSIRVIWEGYSARRLSVWGHLLIASARPLLCGCGVRPVDSFV